MEGNSKDWYKVSGRLKGVEGAIAELTEKLANKSTYFFNNDENTTLDAIILLCELAKELYAEADMLFNQEEMEKKAKEAQEEIDAIARKMPKTEGEIKHINNILPQREGTENE